jgi:hydroxymethylbilane synthase
MTALRLGTRRSPLAWTQAETVAAALTAATGREVELVGIVSDGDRTTVPLTEAGGTGVFVAALRQALLAGEVDAAVHSLKDLPTAPDPQLTLAAIPPRADARDSLVAADGAGVADLPAGAVIGTGSPRRAAQLRAHAAVTGRRFEIRPIRGNVDSRISRVGHDCDAVVLAQAGLDRLGRGDAGTPIDPALMLPAPGQGALAVETRAADASTAAACATLDDATTRACVTAERALLAALEAGCSAPVGALATQDGPVLTLTAVASAVDGSTTVRRSQTGPADQPAELGRRLADELLAAGADALIGETVK